MSDDKNIFFFPLERCFPGLSTRKHRCLRGNAPTGPEMQEFMQEHVAFPTLFDVFLASSGILNLRLQYNVGTHVMREFRGVLHVKSNVLRTTSSERSRCYGKVRPSQNLFTAYVGNMKY